MYKVIFADDEPIIRESIHRIVNWESCGFNLIASVTNGHELIEAVEEHNPDLVITDINMPFIDGLQAGREIRRINPNIKLVILTGYNEIEYVHEALNLKVYKYILKPISSNKLMETLEGIKKDLDLERKKNEKLLEIQGLYTTGLTTLQNMYLNYLLKNTEDKNSLTENAKALSLDILLRDVFTVAYMGTDYSSLSNNKMSKEASRFALYNIANDIINDEKDGFVILNENQVVILFCLNTENNEGINYEKIEIVMESIRANIKLIYNFDIFVGIGRHVKDTKEIRLSFEEAKCAAKFAENTNQNLIVNIKDIQQNFNTDINLTSNPFINSLDLLLVSNENDIKENIMYIYENNNIFDVNYLRLYVTDIILILIKKAESIGIEFDSFIHEYLPISINNLEEPLHILEKLSDFLNVYINKTKISHEKNKKTAFLKAKEYIDENYSNLEISLQNVCENIHLSQSYFRSIFKQETGMTFGNYLTTLRMDKSKKMITETNLKNYEIAELVGYSDPHYFSYCFKKFYGMSPNHYRKRQTSKL